MPIKSDFRVSGTYTCCDLLLDEDTCSICGEADVDAEMYDPRENEDDSFPVHAECGLQNGWEVA